MPEPRVDPRSGRGRVALFALACLLCVAVTSGYVAFKARAAHESVPSVGATADDDDALQTILSGPHLLFVDTPDTIHMRLAVAPLDAPESTRYVTGTTCDRVYFAAGHGLCLGSEEHYYGNRGANQLDAKLHLGQKYDKVLGISSRARVSPDGRMGSVTVFVSGDSYGAPFSTRTHIIDLAAGRDLGTLEDFTVYKDGAVFQSPDFNFWGTTFAADGNRFYATLATGSVGATTYLIEGDVAKRTLRVLRTNVECPSLSPDGTRIAFKKRVEGANKWRISVLDLATLQDKELNETRSVDDQVEWLDDAHVLYGLVRQLPDSAFTTDIWKASVDDESQPPEVFLENALSPAVAR